MYTIIKCGLARTKSMSCEDLEWLRGIFDSEKPLLKGGESITIRDQNGALVEEYVQDDAAVQDVGVWDNESNTTGDHHCRRCGGTGKFITYMENGKLKGPGGICFKCNGKGYHNQADRRRNAAWEQHSYSRGL